MIRISFSPAFTIMPNKNIIGLKLIITDRTYIHRLSFPFTFIYIYYIIFFYKNQKRFFKAVFDLADRKPASCVITPKVRRAHRTTHYRIATSKPTFEVFRDLPLGSVQKNSYFMAAALRADRRLSVSETDVQSRYTRPQYLLGIKLIPNLYLIFFLYH